MIKKVSYSNASKFLYYLTDKGLDLIPLMVELMELGCRYNPKVVKMNIWNKSIYGPCVLFRIKIVQLIE